MAIIEIDGKEYEVDSGKMIIEVADDMGVTIPRFCYHKKLSVAANCRMCLVEVEKARKPMPACATPVTDGMKVFTKSETALAAQKAVMEFLLINHPLDCPICDQGGECELQDVSMGYGQGASAYSEGKRAVDDDDLGPLISTEMTRCIHCTRCVRFGEEVAGFRELGATGRGENMQIGTYIKHSIRSEVSGNVIDLCPVGALTSKPYRFSARSWELSQYDSIAPHDCLGSNLHLHVRGMQVMRTVPKENESINETWLSDRDRYSYVGLNSDDRLTTPMIKTNGQWESVDWETALTRAAKGIKKIIEQHGSKQVAAFCSPSSTLEEQFLLQKWMRGIGVSHLDHRLHQSDFSDQDNAPLMPVSSVEPSDIEKQEALLLLGSNIQREQPLLGLRVRKAFRQDAVVMALNPVDYEFNFELKEKIISSPQSIPFDLAKIVIALSEQTGRALPSDSAALFIGIEADEASNAVASNLIKAKTKAVILGAIAINHPNASVIRALTVLMQTVIDVEVITLSVGANSAGGWLSGMLPHRGALGADVNTKGMAINEALASKLKAYVLLNLEPSYDIANPHLARQAMLAAEFVLMMTAYKSDAMLDFADVLLPIAPFAETSGTYINCSQQWQSFQGAVAPKGDARPAWKVLRVMANLWDLDGFDHQSSKHVLEEISQLKKVMAFTAKEWYCPQQMPAQTDQLVRIGEWPMNRVDSICRHSLPLQLSASSETPIVRIHPTTAKQLGIKDTVTVSQGEIEINLPLLIDERVALDAVYVANSLDETVDLGDAFAQITIKP